MVELPIDSLHPPLDSQAQVPKASIIIYNTDSTVVYNTDSTIVGYYYFILLNFSVCLSVCLSV